MGYLGDDYMTGSGYSTIGDDITVRDWCSDQNPQGNCKAIKNICKPMNVETLNKFKTLQRQVNKFFGKGVIDVDGRIGPKTVSSTNDVLTAIRGPGANFGHCDQLAARAGETAAAISKHTSGKPDVKDPVGGSPPSVAVAVPGGGTKVFNPPGQAGFVQFVKSPIGMASVAGAVVLFLVMSDKKKPKKKSKPRRKRRLAKKRITQSYY